MSWVGQLEGESFGPTLVPATQKGLAASWAAWHRGSTVQSLGVRANVDRFVGDVAGDLPTLRRLGVRRFLGRGFGSFFSVAGLDGKI